MLKQLKHKYPGNREVRLEQQGTGKSRVFAHFLRIGGNFLLVASTPIYTIQTSTYTDTQTHRHTDTQTHRHTDTQTHRHTDKQTHKHIGTQTYTRQKILHVQTQRRRWTRRRTFDY